MNLYKKIKHSIDPNQIEKAIADFEEQIDFEIVPVVTPKSSYVEHITWILSLLFLIFFMGLIEFIFTTYFGDSWHNPFYFYLLAPFVSFLCGALLDKSDIVDRFFISKREQVRQVQENAERFFLKQRLDGVKSENALLLFISVMERQIVLYHDPRLKLENIQELEQKLLVTLQKAFKNKNYEQGILTAIQELKQELDPMFKRKSDSNQANLLPNRITWLE